jgi:hypothetical protein
MVRIVSMIILIIVNVICFDKYGGVNAIEYDTSYIDKHKEDAMSFLKDAEVGKLETTMNENYFDCKEIKEGERDKYEKCREEASKMKESAINAKEQEYKSYNLKRKGEEWAEQGGSTGEGMSKAEKDASEAFLNVHNNKGAELAVNSYREINKDMALGNEITKNPMARVNSKQETTDGDMLEGGECAVSDREDGADEVKLEEYEEIIEDTEIEEEGHVCEKDVRGPFYCEERLEDLECESKVPCAFDKAEGEGGLYTSSSNREFASSSGGKFKWNYNEGTGELMFGNESSYSYDDADESCLTKQFTAKFFIKDKVNVSEFAMSEVFENNVMDIWVNGSLIYEGERYGVRTSRPECRATRGGGGLLMGLNIFGGNDEACWLNACHEHWRSHYKDLKYYIRDGWNEVKVRLRYTRSGHAGLKIKAKQYCCQKWKDKWQGDCPK